MLTDRSARARSSADVGPDTMRSASFSYASNELDALAGAGNYYRSITRRFAPFLGKRILEVGAGFGTFADHLLNQVPEARLTLVEPAQNNFPVLKERFASDPRVETLNTYLEHVTRSEGVDSVVAVNVLEHVEDQPSFLGAAHRLLLPGGHLLLYVPALPVLFGSLDEVFEHHRRYTKRTLSELLQVGRFRLKELRYTNLPGVLSWFISGRVLRRRSIAAREVKTYDRYVMPLVTASERLISPPVGQSLIAIAVRR